MLPDLYTHHLTPKEYFNQLCLTFTELVGQFEEDDGEHTKMEVFAEYTIKQIISSNWDKLKSCFEFQEQRINSLDPKLENALNVSYCESLLLGEVGQDPNKFIPFMGPLLAKCYHEYEEYYNNLGDQWNKLNKIN